MKYNTTWFKENIEIFIVNYEVNYRFFPNGDYGDLYRIEFNNLDKGGCVELWSSGAICVEIYDYRNEKNIINKFFLPEEQEIAKELLTNIWKYL